LIEASDIDSNPSDPFEELFKIDDLATSSSDSNTSNNITLKQINVLTQYQEFILEAIKKLDDPQLQKNLPRQTLNFL
jgi:hypothetical protein